jgi:hypothetical protein
MIATTLIGAQPEEFSTLQKREALVLVLIQHLLVVDQVLCNQIYE